MIIVNIYLKKIKYCKIIFLFIIIVKLVLLQENN